MAKRKSVADKKIIYPLADALEYNGAYSDDNNQCAIFGLENRVKKKNCAINKGLIKLDDVENKIYKTDLSETNLLSGWGKENIALANSDLQSALTYCKTAIDGFNAGEIDLEKLILHSISLGCEIGRAGLIGLALHGHKSIRQKQTAPQKKSKLIDVFVQENYEKAYLKLKTKNANILKKEITAELVSLAENELNLNLVNVDRVLSERLTNFYRSKVFKSIDQLKFKAIAGARKNKGLQSEASTVNAEYERCLLLLVKADLEAGIYQPLYQAAEKTKMGLNSVVSEFLKYESMQTDGVPRFEFYVDPLPPFDWKNEYF